MSHGALVTDLASTDTQGFTPAYSLPAVGTADSTPPNVGDAAFPGALRHVASYGTFTATGTGNASQLDLVAGQFIPDPSTPAVGTERVFNSISANVFYDSPGNPLSSDYVPPTIDTSQATTSPSSVQLRCPGDDVEPGRPCARGARALHRLGQSRTLDSCDASPIGIRQLDRERPSTKSGQVQYIVQAVDSAGNVAVSDNEGSDFDGAPQPALSITLSGSPEVGGYYAGPVTANITAPDGSTYVLDGSTSTAVPSDDQVVVTGSGEHTITVSDPSNDVATRTLSRSRRLRHRSVSPRRRTPRSSETTSSTPRRSHPRARARAPRRDVEFLDGTTPIAACGGAGGTGVNGAGMAVCEVSYDDPGGHDITATYLGDSNFAGSSSAPLDQSVVGSATTTTLTSSAEPSMVGKSVTFKAKVKSQTHGSGSPTGNVEFLDGSTPIAACGGAGGEPISGSQPVVCSQTFRSTGVDEITAVYLGSGAFVASSSPVFSQVVTSKSCKSFVQCNLSGLDLAGANLSGDDLASANLSGANLTGANLSETDAYGANFAGANMTGMSAVGAAMSGNGHAGHESGSSQLLGCEPEQCESEGNQTQGNELHGGQAQGHQVLSTAPSVHSDGAPPVRDDAAAPGVLTPYLPRIALDWLVDTPELSSRELEGTVVFVDVSGFTKLTERLAARGKAGAEEITEVIGTVFGGLLEIANAYGADLLKWGGDAVLLLFDGPDSPQRSTRAAVLMSRAMSKIGRFKTSAGQVRLGVSISAHSDVFDVYLLGDRHKELIVTGPAATTVTRLEAIAESGEVVVSPETASQFNHRVLGGSKEAGAGAGGGFLVTGLPEADAVALLPWSVRPDLDFASLMSAGRAQQLRSVAESGVGDDGEHRQATVAFLEYSGIDALTRSSGPDAVAEALHPVICRAEAAADRNGVSFHETDIGADGGKIVLVGGVPQVQGNDSERVLRAVHDVVSEHPVDSPVRLRAGVNAGRVFVFTHDFAVVGRRIFAITGDAVNLPGAGDGTRRPRAGGRDGGGPHARTQPFRDRAVASLQRQGEVRVRGRRTGRRVTAGIDVGRGLRPALCRAVSRVGGDPRTCSRGEARLGICGGHTRTCGDR